jgi:hypothetical protein
MQFCKHVSFQALGVGPNHEVKVPKSKFNRKISNQIMENTTSETVYSHTNCHGNTYSLTPWSRVLVENLTGLQLAKNFPAFYGIRRFITAFTSACHLSLS